MKTQTLVSSVRRCFASFRFSFRQVGAVVRRCDHYGVFMVVLSGDRAGLAFSISPRGSPGGFKDFGLQT